MNRKTAYARLSIFSNTFLIIIKVIVGFLTGSVSIVSEAIHSAVDLLAALIAYISVRVSDIPPDENHPYGHEKIENVSGVVEALLVFAAAAFIIIEAVKKIMNLEPVESIGLGLGVMFVSALVNLVVSRKLYRVAREEESVALEADALHLKADVYTSIGVACGLGLMWIAGICCGKQLPIIDPIVAIIIAIVILKESWEMLRKAFRPLLDARISKAEIRLIQSAVKSCGRDYIDIHDIRTRRSGKTKHIDFHLTVPDDITAKEAHDICDQLEREIEKIIRNTCVLIHAEPCGRSISQLKKEKTKKRPPAKRSKAGKNGTTKAK